MFLLVQLELDLYRLYPRILVHCTIYYIWIISKAFVENLTKQNNEILY